MWEGTDSNDTVTILRIVNTKEKKPPQLLNVQATIK